MKVAIQGTRQFEAYETFLLGMYSVLANLPEGDKQILFYSAGPANINSMAIGFCNIVSDSLKRNGIKARVIKLPPSEIKSKFHEIDRMLFFCNPKDKVTDLFHFFEAKDPGTDSDFITVWRL